MSVSEVDLTIISLFISAIWILVLYIRDRHSSSAERSSVLSERMLEIDKLIMSYPDIQEYMSLTATETEEHFLDPEILKNKTFYKAKALAYMYMDLFDEILFLAAHSKTGPMLLMPPDVIELSDWEEYIRRKFRHPLYRTILNNEGEIFGDALRKFWSESKQSIGRESANPFVW